MSQQATVLSNLSTSEQGRNDSSMHDVMKTFLNPQKCTSQALAGVNSANLSNLMKSQSLIDHAFQSGVNYTKTILLEDQLEMLRRTHRET